MRTLVDIPDRQIRALAELCDKVNQPRAAVIRAAIDEYLARHTPGARDDAFGLWDARTPDGVALQRGLRDEW